MMSIDKQITMKDNRQSQSSCHSSSRHTNIFCTKPNFNVCQIRLSSFSTEKFCLSPKFGLSIQHHPGLFSKYTETSSSIWPMGAGDTIKTSSVLCDETQTTLNQSLVGADRSDATHCAFHIRTKSSSTEVSMIAGEQSPSYSVAPSCTKIDSTIVSMESARQSKVCIKSKYKQKTDCDNQTGLSLSPISSTTISSSRSNRKLCIQLKLPFTGRVQNSDSRRELHKYRHEQTILLSHSFGGLSPSIEPNPVP